MKVEFNFEYPEKLQPVFDSKKRYIVLKGGRDGAKSHFLGRFCLRNRMFKERRDLICVRENQKNLEQSNYKLLKNLIGQYELPFKVYADKIISLVNGSEIIFEGMNNITEHNIKSYEGFHDAWIEEGQKFSQSSFELLDPTIRQQGSQILVSMNPLYEDDPVLVEIQNVHYNDALIIHINYNEHTFCNADTLKRINNKRLNDPEGYKHIYLGMPKSGAGLKVVKNWDIENERDISYFRDEPIIVGMDFNRDPMCWVLCHKDKESLYQFSEHVRENTWVRPHIRELIEKYGDNERGFIIGGDASGNQLRSEGEGSCFLEVKNEFIRKGYREIEADEIEAGEYYDCEKDKYLRTVGGKFFAFNLSGANPSRSARFNSFNNLVLSDTGQRNFFINKDKCPWTYYNIKNLKQKPGSNDFDIPTLTQIKKDSTFINVLKFMGHPYDAVSYIVYRYWPIRKEEE